MCPAEDAMVSEENNMNQAVVAVVSDQKQETQSFICVFYDQTNPKWKAAKFHQNICSTTTVIQLYELVAQKNNYKFGTFLLAYFARDEEIDIDYNCEDTLYDILKDANEKRHNFLIKQKDGVDPVTVIVDSISAVPQVSHREIYIICIQRNISTLILLLNLYIYILLIH